MNNDLNHKQKTSEMKWQIQEEIGLKEKKISEIKLGRIEEWKPGTSGSCL
jgi:hypothetical protein